MADKKDKEVSDENRPKQPHDAYFNAIMKEIQNSDALVRGFLPQEITELFTSKAPQPLPGKYIDERLAPHMSDMAFQVQLKNGDDAYIYALIEHKSSSEPRVALQLLRYMIRLWSDWVKDKENKGKSLPVIVPLVFYHGKSRWTIPTRLAPIFGDIPEIMRPYIPDFSYELTDLGQIADKDLSKDKRLAALLTPMKYIFKTDIMVSLKESENGLLELDKVDIITWMAYILNVRNDIDREDIASVMNHLPAPQREEIMAGLAQEFKDEWYQKGIADGKATGVTTAEIRFLTRILEKRIGKIPNLIMQRIEKADAETLDSWFSKAIEATSFDDVFKDVN